MKSTSSLVGHLGAVCIKSWYGRVSPRPALAVVVGASYSAGTTGHVPIFGYTVMNDIMAPGMRSAGRSEKAPGKPCVANHDIEISALSNSVDTFGPLGPFITVDDLDVDLRQVAVISSIDGRECSRWSTCELPVSMSSILQSLSAVVRLDPGDIVAFSMNDGRFDRGRGEDLAEACGDVRVGIENLCTLVNPVRRC
ncbi:2-keto-4-pentenoate hydratase/2-oxohepta-3-ene-1,7-dioic acid hydratase in catechol pathway [Paraburkholderia sp. MM5384-R2]|nr:2-keto-4-pentenoate hydratase/2-oxohepta-3-ene-1,7-dioic acid hydratase in catechol pathway [Paraburkholderia sp. MM5384-R2]